jgi:branched-chain amino acid transport system substrate-binding protein
MKKLLSMLTLTTALVAAGGASAQTMDKNVKIGSLGDMSSLYADIGGQGSVVAAQMAVDDSGLLKEGWKIEVISADHQNKPDVGANIARQWIDVDKVDAFVDLASSGVGLAVANVAKEKNVVNLNSGSATSDLTNSACNANTIHWAYDTYMLANGTGKAIVKAGGDTWFFLTADYAFGHALERDTAAVVTANGGKVLGEVAHPLNTSDFSSYLLQAQASKAKIIGLANAGGDTTNSIKQASEFGIVSGGQKLAGLLLFITDINALGLNVTQGLNFTTTFYWDMNDQTRAFTKRFNEKYKKSPPTMPMAGVYSSTLHYLKALKELGGNPHDGRVVVAKMKSMPTDDPLFGKGTIQPNGRKLHPAYLVEVKKPSESKYPWDYLKIVSTIPADQAFTPLDKSTCSLLK